MKCDGCGTESPLAERWASVFVCEMDDGAIMTRAEPEQKFCTKCWERGLAAIKDKVQA